VHQIGQGNNPQSMVLPGTRNQQNVPQQNFRPNGPNQIPQNRPQQQWQQQQNPQVPQQRPPGQSAVLPNVPEIAHRPESAQTGGQISNSVNAAFKAVQEGVSGIQEGIKETAQEGLKKAEEAARKVGEIFDGVNVVNENIITPETQLPTPKDIPSRDVAALIASVNSIDLNLIYSQQVKEVRKLTQDNDIEVKDCFENYQL